MPEVCVERFAPDVEGICGDVHRYAERHKAREELLVKLRHGQPILQGKRERTALAGKHLEFVRDEVEVDLEGQPTVRNWTAAQSPRGDVQGDVPPMVKRCAAPETYLAHYLHVA